MQQPFHQRGNNQDNTTEITESKAIYDSDYIDFESLLRIYYERLFPFKKMYQWLNYGTEVFPHNNNFSHREFSFTLADDVYLRFQSFISEAEFQDKVAKLNPYKIDIGAIYNAKPCERKSINGNVFRPLEKELVFDIDMTDYDEVRKCCQDKKICKKCWKFIAVAVKIIDAALAGTNSKIHVQFI